MSVVDYREESSTSVSSHAQGRSFSGLRTTRIRVTRPSETPNEATVITTPARRATRPGTPLTDRSRSSSPGALMFGLSLLALVRR